MPRKVAGCPTQQPYEVKHRHLTTLQGVTSVPHKEDMRTRLVRDTRAHMVTPGCKSWRIKIVHQNTCILLDTANRSSKLPTYERK
ncbi:hypothetical protein GOBAR_DD24109 [Gossypium barbadense]|nr:hypothetical protein GOBAR_DD24109 [Gossypium barbadense]